MYDELQGFKAFLAESELAPVSPEAGHAELSRLERGHYFFGLKADHKLAGDFMKGHLTGPAFARAVPLTAGDISKHITELSPEKDSLVLVCLPKRWDVKLGRGKNHFETFSKMMGYSGQSAKYVWGAYSLYNPRTEELGQGQFFRNPNYHADDSMVDGWLKQNPVPTVEKPAVPLSHQPRLFGHHLLDQGRHSFHGYKEPELPQTN